MLTPSVIRPQFSLQKIGKRFVFAKLGQIGAFDQNIEVNLTQIIFLKLLLKSTLKQLQEGIANVDQLVSYRC